MIKKLKDDKCARCDLASAKCEDCNCGTGIDCVSVDECQQRCHPKGQLYKCSWKSGTPTCVEDDEGTMSKAQCAQTCVPVPYGKCDYVNNDCVKCDPNTDHECKFDMNYCKVARNEGRCHQQNLAGLWRGIETNI